MKVLTTIAEVRQQRAGVFGTLALVPTMGALHAGHLSLIEVARTRADQVAVSIFVNPTQFGPREDFSRYPRPIETDLEKCQSAGVDWVFSPAEAEMYPPNLPNIVIDLPPLDSVLEGKHRPGHFRGVCQVVAKLFNIIRPDTACFGQKDFQQLRVLSAMVESLNWPIDMVACPTLRDPDGLAMSSRNQYLSPVERQKALAISRTLFHRPRRGRIGCQAGQPVGHQHAARSARTASVGRLHRRSRPADAKKRGTDDRPHGAGDRRPRGCDPAD